MIGSLPGSQPAGSASSPQRRKRVVVGSAGLRFLPSRPLGGQVTTRTAELGEDEIFLVLRTDEG